MRAVGYLLALVALPAVMLAQSDPVIASVQQALKDQGFYYGEITGRKDADTTAAIRRYQIRNGLQITGELNAETQKSLGIQGAATPAPRPSATIAPRPAPTADTSDLLDDEPGEPQPAPPSPDIAPDVHSIFAGTPYEIAPVEVQRRVILGAQTLLARRGLYRSTIDGEFGPNTQFALRAFQSRFGLEPNGRLDMETLAALGLLPGQRAPGVVAPLRRGPRPPRPVMVAPNGEPIYEPR
jgi:peptidoglycan hydrolase-like protein with peptidoglycan-binding domain